MFRVPEKVWSPPSAWRQTMRVPRCSPGWTRTTWPIQGVWSYRGDSWNADRTWPDAVGSGYRRYERWINALHQPSSVLRDLFVECPIAHPTLMLRAMAFRAVGGYRERGWPEDYDLVLRLHRRGMQMANVPRVLVRWRVTPGRLSMTSPNYAPEAFRACKAHHLRDGFLPADRPVVVWGAGRVGKTLALALLEERVKPAAFVELDPRKIGQTIHDAEVIRPLDLEAWEPRPYVLLGVGSPGARAEIREALEGMGYTELDDYRAMA